MAWSRKIKEEKKDGEKVSDPRVQSYRTEEERVAAAVSGKSKMPDEPAALLNDEVGEVGDAGLKVVKFEVVMPEQMYRKMLGILRREDYFGLNDFVCECVRVRTVCAEAEDD